MALIPVIDEDVVADFEYTQEPGHTYRMNVDLDDGTAGQFVGYVDGREAVEQAAYKILNTERGENEIYGGQYGVETDDLLGMPISYVCPEYERRTREALLMDDRITGAGSCQKTPSGRPSASSAP